MADPNPFTGTPDLAMAEVEELLCSIYRSGEWDDKHEAVLDHWRAARGDAGKDHWRWWTGEVDGESYDFDFDSRAAAIAYGCKQYADEGRFQIIEARTWADLVKDGEDICPFAETRNHEIVAVEKSAA